jgi:hypothetical protein
MRDPSLAAEWIGGEVMSGADVHGRGRRLVIFDGAK